MRISKSFIIAASMLLNISFATSQSYLPHSDGEVVRHTYYTLSYIEEHEQAEWVAYEMTPRNAESNVTRNDSFKADPKVSTASALPTDYQGSGYDRGHLCPAASMSFDKVAMEESFYMSNMSPQAPTFNRDGWMRLEKLVRGWAAADSVIYVVTGPILSNPKGSLKRGGVTIPSSYYKVVFSPRKGEMIGFVMPNDKIGKALEGYAVTIDEVEAQTGIDLFAGGDFDKEEATIDLSAWSFTTTKTKTQTTDANTSATRVDPPQCKGVTTKGKQCRNTTTNANGYCHLHQSQAE